MMPRKKNPWPAESPRILGGCSTSALEGRSPRLKSCAHRTGVENPGIRKAAIKKRLDATMLLHDECQRWIRVNKKL